MLSQLFIIDSDRPVFLTPLRYEVCTSDEVTAILEKLGQPPLLSTPIDDGAHGLTIERPGEFLDWLIVSPWGRKLEVMLQSVAEDEDGAPFLSSWLNIMEWTALVADAAAQPFGPVLAQALESWIALGADEVGFDGYILAGYDPDGGDVEDGSGAPQYTPA